MDNNTENTVRTLLSLLLIWSRSQIEPTLTAGFFEYARQRFEVNRAARGRRFFFYYVHSRRMDYTSSSSGCVAVRVRMSAH